MDEYPYAMPGRTCTQSKNGYHEMTVTGTPRSAMTYWNCNLCYGQWPRGTGLFYKPTSHSANPEHTK